MSLIRVSCANAHDLISSRLRDFGVMTAEFSGGVAVLAAIFLMLQGPHMTFSDLDLGQPHAQSNIVSTQRLRIQTLNAASCEILLTVRSLLGADCIVL